MIRAGILIVLLGIGIADVLRKPVIAWPLRATITDLHGRSIPIRAVTLGGELIVDRSPDGMHPQPLASGDTFVTRTPANFALDLKHGSVRFFATGHDSIQVVVGWNPFGATRQVRATGRQLTVRLVRDSIAVRAQ